MSNFFSKIIHPSGSELTEASAWLFPERGIFLSESGTAFSLPSFREINTSFLQWTICSRSGISGWLSRRDVKKGCAAFPCPGRKSNWLSHYKDAGFSKGVGFRNADCRMRIVNWIINSNPHSKIEKPIGPARTGSSQDWWENSLWTKICLWPSRLLNGYENIKRSIDKNACERLELNTRNHDKSICSLTYHLKANFY